MNSIRSSRSPRFAMMTLGATLALAACGSTVDSAADTADSAVEESATSTTTTEAATQESEEATVEPTSAEATADCEEIASSFVTRGSANPELDDPEVAATCDGDSITITSNAIPDYTYIGTSPGNPGGRDVTFTITSEPTLAEEATEIPYIGAAGVTLSGIPIYGPTEGTGGDVDSLPGIVSACGSHNGPTGFHTHKILNPAETDCFFAPEEVADEPQLVGYALDGFPIYTGIDQYTSSWELTDETLFASDTWQAHSYVEGSGDLDECNGLTDEEGNYAYYTTEEFPYVLGCFAGEIDLAAAGGGGGGGGGGADEGEGGGERPERAEGGDDQ